MVAIQWLVSHQSLAPDYPYSDNGRPPQTADSEYPDCFVSIAAMAAVTSTIRFTTGVYVLPLRNPIELAKATATLSILSRGRFVLGVGSGWMKEEFDIYGVDFKSRGGRFTESIEVLRKLWGGGMVDHHGDFFDFPAIMERLRELRAEAGRDHLPFETLVGLLTTPDLATFRAMRDTGMTSGLSMPFSYVLGEQSSLDDKKRLMETFAREVIRYFV